jgi:hypothetical protein
MMRTNSGIAALAALSLASGCGGGGGDDGGNPPVTSATFSLTTSTLNFTTSSPFANPPLEIVGGNVTGTVNGNLIVVVQVAGPAVRNVTVQNNGSAVIDAEYPSKLGVGTHTSTITVRACVNDPTCATGNLNGSPQTLNVTYTIGPTAFPGIYPRTVVAGRSGTVRLRTNGLPDTVTSVETAEAGPLFPTLTPVTSFTKVSGQEIEVTYPAMAAGHYNFYVNGQSVDPRNFVVVEAPDLVAATLTYPVTPTEIGGIVYNALHGQLIVAVLEADPNQGQVVTYDVSGTVFGPGQATSSPRLRTIVQAQNGMDTITLAYVKRTTTSNTPASGGGTNSGLSATGFMRSAAATNEGMLFVTGDADPSSPQQAFLIRSTSGTDITSLSWTTFAQAVVGASGDGSRVVIVPSGTNGSDVFQYRALNSQMSDTSLDFSHGGTLRAPALDRNGNRIILSNTTATNVYDGSYQLLGTLPASTRAYVLSSDGARAYTYDSAGEVRVFDVSATANGGVYPQLGMGIPVSDPGDGALSMIITPDDGTVFIAGVDGVVVQGVP